MITKYTKLYTCEHCKKKMFRKYSMAVHEKFCGANPDNFKACTGCANLEETYIDLIYANEGGRTSCKAFNCKALNKMVYPVKVEKRNLIQKFPETFKDQIPMPRACDLRKDELSFCEPDELIYR